MIASSGEVVDTPSSGITGVMPHTEQKQVLCARVRALRASIADGPAVQLQHPQPRLGPEFSESLAHRDREPRPDAALPLKHPEERPQGVLALEICFLVAGRRVVWVRRAEAAARLVHGAPPRAPQPQHLQPRAPLEALAERRARPAVRGQHGLDREARQRAAPAVGSRRVGVGPEAAAAAAERRENLPQGVAPFQPQVDEAQLPQRAVAPQRPRERARGRDARGRVADHPVVAGPGRHVRPFEGEAGEGRVGLQGAEEESEAAVVVRRGE